MNRVRIEVQDTGGTVENRLSDVVATAAIAVGSVLFVPAGACQSSKIGFLAQGRESAGVTAGMKVASASTEDSDVGFRARATMDAKRYLEESPVLEGAWKHAVYAIGRQFKGSGSASSLESDPDSGYLKILVTVRGESVDSEALLDWAAEFLTLQPRGVRPRLAFVGE